MRIVVLLAALVIIAIGLGGIVAPDSLMALRREYVVTEYGPYAIGSIRVAIGLLMMAVAPTSRMPKAVRVLGLLVCVQGLTQIVGTPFIGLARARAILEWAASHPALLRVGALLALIIGGFMVYAVRPPATGGSPASHS